jgi:hypothetical protein
MDEYKLQAVELIGWGAKSRTQAVSGSLKRILIQVFPIR